MRELIDKELLQLQKDLENLQSAAEMISQAGTASDCVIKEAKNIHQEFSKNMEKLTNIYQQYIQQINEKSEKKQDEMGNTINKLAKASEEKLSEQANLLKNNAQEALSKIELVKSVYLKQTEKTDSLLNSYLELAQSTTELKDKISGIDFPARLDKMASEVKEISQKQDKNNAEIEKLSNLITQDKALKQTQSNGKSLKSIKAMVWILFFMSLLTISGLVFMMYKSGIRLSF